VSLERIEADRYEAGTTELAPGAWTAAIAVERAGVPLAVTTATWSVAPVAVTDAGPLEIITGALALLALLAAAVVGVARRRAHPAATTKALVAATRSPR
jgi:hypothetical protein